jgi:hypothetical protein
VPREVAVALRARGLQPAAPSPPSAAAAPAKRRRGTWQCQSVEEFFLSREEAEACLRQVLADEPGWEETVGLVRLDFSGSEPQVAILA